jgi:probable rRNA maturation factor
MHKQNGRRPRAARRAGTVAGRAGLSVAVRWQPRADWHAVPLLRRVARNVARAEGFRAGELSIVVVGDRAMTTLHAKHLNLATPTDVLTFDLGVDRPRGWLEGEIVLCADVARRHVLRRGGTLAAMRAELALYLVHGLLHLAGYDDHDPAEAARMHAREDALLRRVGLGPVFAG